MTKINQKRFTIVEALIILVVLVLMGVTGWYVYQKSYEVEQSAALNTVEVNKDTDQAVRDDSYRDWKTYENEDFTIMYPPNWVAGEQDSTNSDPHLSIYHFGVKGELNEATPDYGITRFTVSVYRQGYYMGDVGDSRQLVDENMDAATFARKMNGLASEQDFSQVTEQIRMIGGVKALQYVGEKMSTPWVLKLNDTIYSFKSYSLSDSDAIAQSDLFDQSLKSIKLLR